MEILGKQFEFSDQIPSLDAIESLLSDGKIVDEARLIDLYTGKLYLPKHLCRDVLGLSSDDFIDCHTFAFILLVKAGLIDISESEVPNKAELLSEMQASTPGKAQSYMRKINIFAGNVYSNGAKFKISLPQNSAIQGWDVADRMRRLAGTIAHSFMSMPHSRYVQITAHGGSESIHSFLVVGTMEKQKDLICLEVKGLNDPSPRIVRLSQILQEYCSGANDNREVVLSTDLPRIILDGPDDSDELPMPEEIACLQSFLGELAKFQRH